VAEPSRPATLKDIATALGVDVSTVSKVLSGGGISVRAETRVAIEQTAARLNYRPHALARTLRTQRSGALGVLLPNLTNPVYASIVRGAVRRADEKGYVTLVADVDDEEASAGTYRKLVGERRIDGLILAVSAEPALIEAIEAHPLPHVFVNRRSGIGRSVTVDDFGAGRLAAETFARFGHRHVGFIGADDTLDTARRRRAGFSAGCADLGLAWQDARFPYSRDGGFRAMRALMERPERPTAVFASNLLVGVGAVAFTAGAGIAVPGEVSLLTLEAEDAQYTSPPLSAIALPLEKMGARAVDEVDAVLAGGETQDVTIEEGPALVLRQSLGPAPDRAPGHAPDARPPPGARGDR
jgi:DNA-binding LacI/PurR family transcriptional regulator